jgi:hypothetical protein
MKTKNIILTTCCLLLFVVAASAQTYSSQTYYDKTKTFYENGFTYQCDNEERYITLYNKQNRYTYAEKAYKDGRKLPEDISDGRISAIEVETWSRPKARAIVNAAFSTQEKALVKGERFTISMYIDPDTGKVVEVNFGFWNRSPFGRIPPSTYYKIEQRLKQEIWFTMTEVGKQLNFGFLFWGHEVE